MSLKKFSEQTDLLQETEINKVKLLAFYLLTTKQENAFSLEMIIPLFEELHLPKPNISRLTKNIKSSSSFINSNLKGHFKIHATEIKRMEIAHPSSIVKSEKIISTETILPNSLFTDTRGYIELLAQQINATYEYNSFDACAVIMRRLLEILLILAHEYTGEASKIKTVDGHYISLENIIQETKTSKSIALSRDSKSTLDTFRELGNFSAHKIHYNARRSDIDQVKNKFRATIEELIYKANLKK